MDEKKIHAVGKDVSKASDSNESAAVILPLLNQLKTGVRATEPLLRATKIGAIVNKLRTHKDPTIARQATDLVSKWKRDVRGPGGGAGAKTTASGKMGAEKDEAKQENGNSKIAPELRNAKSDNVKTQVTGNDTRDNCVKLMYDGLAFMSEDASSSILPVASSVEHAAFAVFKSETSTDYKAKMRSLFQNLKNKSNPSLRKRVLNGDITPDVFVRMTAEELKSPERSAEDEAIKKENMDKAMVAKAERSISASLQCGKCQQRKVSYSQAQTRSADEPMTTFCECTVCGNRWKFS